MSRSQTMSKGFICLSLVIVTLGVYLPVRHHGFVNYDDPMFVTENSNIRDGLNWRSVHWALSADLIHEDPNSDYWRPLSHLSHALDVELFGLRPSGHHLMSLGLHIAATVALFLVLLSMTNALWRCAFVAALFALHPQHVESVAWVAERKDVLSGLFFFVTLGAYARYASGPFSMRRYLGVLLVFALALMSKPMAVTLPFVLLLLDYWPLGRTQWAKPATGESVKQPPGRLLNEKLPFLVLAIGLSWVTYLGQRRAGDLESLARLPLGMRIGNALRGYVSYIAKAVWPTKLAVFYPLDAAWPMFAVIGTGIGLLGVTAMVLWAARRRPWLATGWFWYLGTLLPVIGLVQVGGQSMADRYTYVPLIGLLIMLAWTVPWSGMESGVVKGFTWAAAAAVVAVSAVWSRVQVGYWKDSETLFRHALSVTQNNWQAHGNLGTVLSRAGKYDEAIEHFEQALRINPNYADAHLNMGTTLLEADKIEDAIGHYRQALRIEPNVAETYYNLGFALERAGKYDEAIEYYEQALRIKPDFALVHAALGNTLLEAGKYDVAIRQYEQALLIRPDYADAHSNLGTALMRLGRVQEAVEHLEQACRISPGMVEAHYNLGIALEQAGRVPEAIKQYEQALHLKPDYAEARIRLAKLRAHQ